MSGALDRAEVRAMLEPWARRLMAEAKGAAVEAAGQAHPLLATLADELLGAILSDATIDTALALLDRMLREMVGDDYPTRIDAARVVIVDNRGQDDGPD